MWICLFSVENFNPFVLGAQKELSIQIWFCKNPRVKFSQFHIRFYKSTWILLIGFPILSVGMLGTILYSSDWVFKYVQQSNWLNWRPISKIQVDFAKSDVELWKFETRVFTEPSFWAPRTNRLKFSTENPQIHIRFSKFHLISFTCQNMGYQLLRTAGNERFEIWSEICGVFEINFPKSGPPYGSNLEHGEFKNQNFWMGFF